MLITFAMTLLRAACVAFYLRCLVALCRECNSRWLAFSKYVRPFSIADSVSIMRTTDIKVAPYAAIPLTRINLDVLLDEPRKENL